MRTLGIRHTSRHGIALHRRIAGGAALAVMAATATILGTAVPAFASATGAATVTPASASAGSTTNYTIAFTATGGIGIGDTITIAAPAGTVFPTPAARYTVNATPTTVATTGGGTATIVITSASVVTAGTTATIVATGVKNPAAGVGQTLTVADTVDTTATTSNPYTITAATAVTAVTAAPVPTTATATATYTVTFTATTALVLGTDTITLTSAGVTFPAIAGTAYTVKDGGGAATPVTVGTPAANTVTITTPVTVTPGSVVVVVITGATNPTAGAKTLSVSTTQDSAVVPSATYTITGPITLVTATTPAPASAGAVASYGIGFTATSALVAGVGTITIAGPGATSFPAGGGNYTVNGTIPTTVTGGGSATVTITTPVAIAAGQAVTVNAVRVTNPAAVVGTTLSVSTSADVTPVASNTYTITAAAGTQVTGVVFTPSPTNASSVATYTITFTATNALTSGSGTITLAGPTGTAFPLVAGDYSVQNGGGTVTTVTAVPTGTTGNVTIVTPVAITAGFVVTVVASGVTNPAAGVTSGTVATSTNVTPTVSTFYTISAAVVSGGGGGGATTPSTPVRVAGTDRFATAIAASTKEFPTTGSAGAVVLARADNYPDALVGTPLAAAKNAPLLFANGGSLTAETSAEIQRVLTVGGTVYLLGGTAAIPDSVAVAVTAMGYVPVRYAGADRFGTALKVADALGDPTTVLLATGTNFPDALAAGPAAAHLGGAVLLTNGGSLTAEVQAYLTAHPGTVYAIGGPSVAADPSATPLSGADRYGTAAAVAAALFASPADVGVASGTAFPDALSGGALEAHFLGPIVLTDPHVLPAPTSNYLTSAKTTIVTTNVFGGTAAVSDTVATAIGTALGM